jgi:UDP-sulfoquinovose synthase
MKRVLILGIDGYIGYALALDLMEKGYEVCGVDNLSRRNFIRLIGSDSLVPIPLISQRIRYLRGLPNYIDSMACINLGDHYLIKRILKEYKPDVIVHLAEQPSAPWSMRDVRSAIDTQVFNISGTLALLWAMKEECPDVHLIKLGTMGEYGTPDCDIPEGMIPKQPCVWTARRQAKKANGEIVLTRTCPMEGLPFPRSPGSFYHLSKVHDTHNIIFACKTWGLHSTDIMQGVVFGYPRYDYTSPNETTRFDYDQYFGTVINRFCTQAIIEHDLTVYGEGEQARGFLPLRDSLQCLNIVIENPPKAGEYRTFNQYGHVHSIILLAILVRNAAKELGIEVDIKNIRNPRIEDNRHYYNPSNQGLLELGYEPTPDIGKEIYKLTEYLQQFKDNVREDVIMPTTKWR